MTGKKSLICKRGSLLPYCYSLAICLVVFPSCNNTQKQEPAQSDTLKSVGSTLSDSLATAIENSDSLGEEYAIYYVVVADSNTNYYPLNARMYELQKRLNWKIDTMNRHYDAVKKRIVLAEDDEDEMYRGAYFPRRDPSTTLSLEYYNVYSPEATQDNIALVAGIFDQKASADSMQSVLRPHAPKSFVIRSKVYVGCMH